LRAGDTTAKNVFQPFHQDPTGPSILKPDIVNTAGRVLRRYTDFREDHAASQDDQQKPPMIGAITGGREDSLANNLTATSGHLTMKSG